MTSAAADALMGIFWMKRVKPKKCAYCKQSFAPFPPGAKVCSVECAESYGKKQTWKALTQTQREGRAADRKKREQLKSRAQWLKEAQIAFNRYVRVRDEKQTCICCGNPLSSGSVGGGYDCGHYRSVGSAPHLRFDERNAHAQRKQCNRWGAGRAVDYRLGLIGRLGVEIVESLESDQEPKHYGIEELKAIKARYVEKLKELKHGHE